MVSFHLCLNIAPKYSVANTVGFLKGKSAIRTCQEYLGKNRNFTGFHFWARGCRVSAIILDEAVIRTYIRDQEKEEKRQEQLILGGALAPLQNDRGSFEGISSNHPHSGLVV